MITTAAQYGLTPERLDELAEELDAIRAGIVDDLGEVDVAYIRRLIAWQRTLELVGRASLFLGWLPPFWLGGTAALSLSKILDNMEIGHNVMHGQYDWTNIPELSSTTFEWDNACPGDQWRHSHNYMHHTYTNIVGKDRDLGYGILRMTDNLPWERKDVLVNPIGATLLALNFEHGVMLHDVEADRVANGERSWDEARETLRGGLAKSGRQALKDYVAWPLLSGPSFLPALAGNATANVVRNVWAFTIIFCGHFPAGTDEFSIEECADESRGHWYFRQMLGSSNLTGSRLFHILTGNLSFQIEHHLFPDLPARRYQQVAGDVRAVCERFGLPYHSGGLAKQFGSVLGKIARFALPDRGRDDAAAPDPLPQRATRRSVAA